MSDGSRGQDIDCVIFGTNCAEGLLATLAFLRRSASLNAGRLRNASKDAAPPFV